MGLMEGVESVKKLFLSSLLAGHTLNIVNKENVHAPEFIPELLHFFVADTVNHLIHEFFRRVETDTRRIVYPLGVIT